MISPETLELLRRLEELNEFAASNDDEVKKIALLCLKNCRDVTKTDPDFIRRWQRALGRAIISYSARSCDVYRDRIPATSFVHDDCLDRVTGSFAITKDDLLDKSGWYIEGSDSTENRTSGSTGSPFKYLIWNPAFLPIERDGHYEMILREFGIEKPRVLHLVSGFVADHDIVTHGEANLKVSRDHQIKNYVQRIHASHGDASAFRMHVDVDDQSFVHMKDFCEGLVSLIKENEINVVLASGTTFELLCTYFVTDESNIFPKVTQLLSNTGDVVNIETLQFLCEAGIAKDYCDHMRCWDGGITFFTCKKGTYHLSEELGYTFATKEKKLGSIDFFNYASPFVNYLNGDYGEIGAEWKQCGCGRWYRPFKFLNKRSRSLRTAGSGYYDYQEVNDMLRSQFKVRFMSFQDCLVTIEASDLSDEDKAKISEELAKKQLVSQFFTQPNLRMMADSSGGSKGSLDH